MKLLKTPTSLMSFTASEEKSQGLKEVHNADDILTRKRGSSEQLTELFVSHGSRRRH